MEQNSGPPIEHASSAPAIAGWSLLVLGAAFQLVVATGVLGEFLSVATEVPKKDDSLFIQAFVAAILLTGVSVAVGRWTAKNYASPPFLYYFLTGVVPGFAIFWGWQNLPSQETTLKTSFRGLAALTAAIILVLGIVLTGSGWVRFQFVRAEDSIKAYETFLKSAPMERFEVEARVRLKELYAREAWEKTKAADTLDAYIGFMRDYSDAENEIWTEAASRRKKLESERGPGSR